MGSRDCSIAFKGQGLRFGAFMYGFCTLGSRSLKIAALLTECPNTHNLMLWAKSKCDLKIRGSAILIEELGTPWNPSVAAIPAKVCNTYKKYISRVLTGELTLMLLYRLNYLQPLNQ